MSFIVQHDNFFLFVTGIQKEELELKFQTSPDLERKFEHIRGKIFIFTFGLFLEKVIAEEERAKMSEEKFQKLKNMYTQIRDEHIKLLRQVEINYIKS